MEATVPIAIAAIAAFLLALGAIIEDRRARARRLIAAVPAYEPPLIHSINDDRCIGCEACVDACPTEVLELVDHKARVIRFSDCVQCEQCANACPTTAMVMFRAGGAPQTLTVPELDEHFQTGVPGQYLIGEVAGKPLVKNAANLGRAVVEHITRDLHNKPAPAGVLDVAIVGSGPGGLSAGLTCLRNKLSCVVLEKEHVLASTVSRYPKGKLFMAEPVDSGNMSYLPVFDASKEDLVAAWQHVVSGSKLPVKLGEAVDSVVRGDDGVFTVKTTVATYRARSVVLATGLRGKPRLLAVPGANLEKVKSRLDDPDELAGQHVLVVGGGDSAVEAAMSLADVGCTVTLSYRGDGFKRCKQGNQKRLAEMTEAGQLSVLLESNVKEITPDAVEIKLKDGTMSRIPNQQAFVLIGADTPVAWLQTAGVRFIEREHLYALGATEDTVKKLAPDATECPKDPAQALANLLGQQPGRTSKPGRLRSMIHHVGDEFREVATGMSQMFSLSDLESSRAHKNKTQTNIKALGYKPKKRTGTAPVIPPEQLVRRPAPTPAPTPHVRPRAMTRNDNPFDAENTVQVSAYGRATAGSRPKPKKEVTEEMLSLPARLAARQLGEVLARRTNNPFDRDPTTVETPAHRQGGTDEFTALQRDLGLARPKQDTTNEFAAFQRDLGVDAKQDGTGEFSALQRDLGLDATKRTDEVTALHHRDDVEVGNTTVETPALRDRGSSHYADSRPRKALPAVPHPRTGPAFDRELVAVVSPTIAPPPIPPAPASTRPTRLPRGTEAPRPPAIPPIPPRRKGP